VQPKAAEAPKPVLEEPKVVAETATPIVEATPVVPPKKKEGGKYRFF
jgi:hypothetical protein